MFNHRLRRAVPVARIALQHDRADGARANVRAAPAPGFCPKFTAYGEVNVFQQDRAGVNERNFAGRRVTPSLVIDNLNVAGALTPRGSGFTPYCRVVPKNILSG